MFGGSCVRVGLCVSRFVCLEVCVCRFVCFEVRPHLSGPMMWVQRQLSCGADPRTVLRQLVPGGGDSLLGLDALDDLTVWKVIINILMEPPRRKKLKHVNTLADVLQLLRTSSNIIVLTGAGVRGGARESQT